MKKSTIIIIVVVAILAIWGVSGYNGLVTMDENVSGQWSNVETQYQRRADLIRFGKYEEIVNKHLGKLGISKPTTVTPDLRYFPYPQNDAQLNVNMANENPSRLPK